MLVQLVLFLVELDVCQHQSVGQSEKSGWGSLAVCGVGGCIAVFIPCHMLLESLLFKCSSMHCL